MYLDTLRLSGRDQIFPENLDSETTGIIFHRAAEPVKNILHHDSGQSFNKPTRALSLVYTVFTWEDMDAIAGISAILQVRVFALSIVSLEP